MKPLAAALTLGAAVLVAAPAVALTCIRPDAARLYTRAAEAESSHVIVEGRLTLDPGRLPRTDKTVPGPEDPVSLPARLEGRALGPEGFERRFDRAIRVEASCIGPWCPRLAPVTRLIAAPRVEDGAYVLPLDACMGWAMTDPTPEDLSRIKSCHDGGACLPEQ